uniref:ATP synthase complex subunit 8 n=1 Tax=Bombus asiaticus TaxID=395507 RepID=A0A482JMN1_9HYME|nr:ATP synthase F0 subunit 8 [Bombus asiaticus]
MPQMMPINWLMIFLLCLMCLMIIMILMNSLLLNFNMKKINNMNFNNKWKWLW